MIVEEKKKTKYNEVPQNTTDNKEVNIIEEVKEPEKVKRKIQLIRLRNADLHDDERGIPAFNKYFKKNHAKVHKLDSNKDKISKWSAYY